MRLVPLAVALAVLAVPAGAAAADERRLTDNGGGIEAEGEWMSWERIDEQVTEGPLGVPQWLRNGRVIPSTAPLGRLGTDARGRVVVLDTRCGARRTCSVTQRRPASTAGKRLISRTRLVVNSADEFRGALGFVGQHAYVRRRGQDRIERVDSLRGEDAEVGNGFLVFRAVLRRDFAVRVVDFRGPRPSAWNAAVDDTSDDGCRCSLSTSAIADMTVEGAYVYWLQWTFTSLDGQPVGVGRDERTADIFRRPVRDPHGRIEVFHPAQPALDFAVDASRVLYSAEGDARASSIFEVRHPDWKPAP
jgi:hypothetical protein